MDTNSHYGHLSVRDVRSLRVANFFVVNPVGEDASPASPMVYPRLHYHTLVSGGQLRLRSKSTNGAQKSVFITFFNNFSLTESN
jgi:hypothetical protein